MDIHAGFTGNNIFCFSVYGSGSPVWYLMSEFTHWYLLLLNIFSFRNIYSGTKYLSLVSTWAKWYFWCLDKILFSLPMNNNVLFLLLPLETLLIEFHGFNYPSFRIPARSPNILEEGTAPGTSLVETGLGPPRLQGSPPRIGPRRGGSNSRRSESCSGEGLYCDVYIPNTPHFHKRWLFKCFTNNSGMSYSVTIKMFFTVIFRVFISVEISVSIISLSGPLASPYNTLLLPKFLYLYI